MDMTMPEGYIERFDERTKDLINGVPLEEDEWNYMLHGHNGLVDGFSWCMVEKSLGLRDGFFVGIDIGDKRPEILTAMFYKSVPKTHNFSEGDIEWV